MIKNNKKRKLYVIDTEAYLSGIILEDEQEEY